MANPTCNATTLITNGAPYKLGTIDPIRRKALRIYAMVLELDALGGTDYTTELTGDLLEDTKMPPTLPNEVDAAHVAIAFDRADTAGASVPATLNEKLAVVKGLIHVPGGCERLDQIALYLECKLGVHKTFPQ